MKLTSKLIVKALRLYDIADDNTSAKEVRSLLINHGEATFRAQRGERVVQLVVQPVDLPEIVLVDDLNDSDRGEGGFGSTGR